MTESDGYRTPGQLPAFNYAELTEMYHAVATRMALLKLLLGLEAMSDKRDEIRDSFDVLHGLSVNVDEARMSIPPEKR